MEKMALEKLREELSQHSAQAIAYHQAGHAVAAVWYGIRLNSVTILPNQARNKFTSDTSGHMAIKLPRRLDADWAERNCVTTYVGVAAERRFSPHTICRKHSRADRSQAISMMTPFSSSKRELDAHLNLLWIRAADFVDTEHHWVKVKAVAKALLEHRTLKASEVRAITNEAVKAKADGQVVERLLQSDMLKAG